MAKQFIVNLNIVVMTRDAEIVSSHPTSPGAARSFTICAPETPACAERFATPPEILDLDRTRDNAPHTTEGWAVLRNMHDALIGSYDRVKCNGHPLLLAFPGIGDATGRGIARKTNFSVAIFLTDSLHQFA